MAVLSCAGTANAVETASASPRTWSDQAGKHSVRATYLAYSEGIVQLRKADDSELTVPLKALSESDQKYVIEQLRRKSLAKRRSSRRVAVTAKRNAVAKSKEVEVDPDSEVVSVARVAEGESLFGIHWQSSPESIRAAASADEEDLKPIMWFRVLGDLAGFM